MGNTIHRPWKSDGDEISIDETQRELQTEITRYENENKNLKLRITEIETQLKTRLEIANVTLIRRYLSDYRNEMYWIPNRVEHEMLLKFMMYYNASLLREFTR